MLTIQAVFFSFCTAIGFQVEPTTDNQISLGDGINTVRVDSVLSLNGEVVSDSIFVSYLDSICVSDFGLREYEPRMTINGTICCADIEVGIADLDDDYLKMVKASWKIWAGRNCLYNLNGHIFHNYHLVGKSTQAIDDAFRCFLLRFDSR